MLIIKDWNGITIIVILTLILLWISRRKPWGFPPGYSGIPLLGVLPFLSNHPAKTFMNWSRNIGPVFYVRIGQKDFVILNNFESVNECLINHGKLTSDRYAFEVYNNIKKGGGIVFQRFTREYKTLRKFGTKALKCSKNEELESKIHVELECMVDTILSHEGKPFNAKNMLTLAVSSVITQLTLGRRLGHRNPKLIKLLDTLGRLVNNQQDSVLIGIISFIYHVRYLPLFRGAFQRLQDNMKAYTNIFNEIIEEREKTFDKNNIKDAIDQFLYNKLFDKEYQGFTNMQLIQTLSDLFGAGTDSTSTSLYWCFLYLAKNPVVQKQLYTEIVEEIGDHNVPSWRHRKSLPIICSFIDEIARHRTLVPLSVFHKTIREINVLEFTLPKDTIIVPNLWAVHNDPRYFKEPEHFKYDRFIDKETGKYSKSQYLIPFSVGPRKCLGYQLAERELFIILCGVLQKFEIIQHRDHPLPAFGDGVFGIFYFPRDFKVAFRKR